jgi:uncharacterized caspase-like protein
MRRFLVTLLLCAAPMMAAAQQRNLTVELRVPGEAPVQLYAESHALVIGASAYRHWSKLGGVPSDVRAVSAALRSTGFKVIEVMDPTLARLEDALRSFVAEQGQNPSNRLLIYFAGHGYTLKSGAGNQLGYLVPVDAPVPSERNIGAFKRAALSMDSIEGLARQIDAKHALFVFDSCFSGTFFKMRAAPESISLKTSQPVRQFITAGAADQPVPDVSVFRRQFVDGIRGGADLDNDGYVTGSELGMFLESRVTNYSRQTQTPQYGKIRDPNLDKGDFVFALTSNPARPGKPAAAPSAAIDPMSVELSMWNDVKDSRNAEELKAYLATFPQGRFVELARVRIKALTTPATSVVAPATPAPAPVASFEYQGPRPVASPPPRNLTIKPAASGGGQRLALVIGNSAYGRNDTLPTLRHAGNDARDIAQALRNDGGFVRMTLLLDADYRAMREAISNFGEDLRRAGSDAIGLFYYAGHGVEVSGRNYLIPLGTRISAPRDLEFDTIDSQRVLAYMEEANNGTNIVVLDASRRNPFPQLLLPPTHGGLAQMNAPTGSVVVFSAAPGQIAIDGDGRNSLFTSQLLESLRQPNSNIDAVFTRVTASVSQMTSRRQVPWKQSSLTSEFYFRPNQ